MNKNKITPNNITFLNENEIFVFGSNLAGKHGKGAAKTALNWGAIYGQAEGLQGQTYAIPTKDEYIKNSLSLDQIQRYVNTFIEFAKNNSNLNFLVTEIGCGLAKYSYSDIAPLFKEAKNVDNIYLPFNFLCYL